MRFNTSIAVTDFDLLKVHTDAYMRPRRGNAPLVAAALKW